MRLAVHSTIFGNMPIEKVFRQLHRLGYRGVEIPGYPARFPRRKRDLLRTLSDELDLEIVTISVGVPFYRSRGRLRLESVDPGVRKRSIEYVKSCVDLAVDVDSKIVYVCTIDEQKHAERFGRVTSVHNAMAVCADYANSHSVVLAVEPYPRSLLGTVKSVLSAIREIGSRNLFIMLDIGHLNLTKESIASSVERSKNSLIHVHLNNNDGFHDLHDPLDIGSLGRKDFGNFLSALKRARYEGYCSLEIREMKEPDRVLARNKRMLNEISSVRDSMNSLSLDFMKERCLEL